MPTTPAIIARNQRILAGHAAGASVRDLALAEAVDPAVVRRILRAAGIPMRQNRYYPNRSRRVDAELADRIVARYLAGAGPREIAAELGVSAQRVRKIVAARGVKRTQSEEVARRKATAAALGRSKRRVYRLLRERGVLRSPGRTRGTRDARQASAAPAPEAPAPETREILPAGLAQQVLARYAAGEPPGAMAVALGVPASRIYRFLRERGVLRSRSEARTLSCALQWAGVARLANGRPRLPCTRPAEPRQR